MTLAPDKFELLEHTADIGMLVKGQTEEELLLNAASALYAVIGEIVCASRGEPQKETYAFSASNKSVLLRDFLAEVLFFFEQKQRALVELKLLEFSNNSLSAVFVTAEIDNALSSFEREVKAVTYHELSYSDLPGDYQAKLIVDI